MLHPRFFLDLEHHSFIQETQTWNRGYYQSPHFALVTIELDHHSHIVRGVLPPLSNNPALLRQYPINAVMFANVPSDLDIITPETFHAMGYNPTGLLIVTDEGHDSFRRANMTLIGGFFAQIGVINPATRQGLYTKALVYVAQTETNRNWMSSLTVDNLRLRGTVGPTHYPLNLPS